MNGLYGILNQSYRDFKAKESISLKESEENNSLPTEEPVKETEEKIEECGANCETKEVKETEEVEAPSSEDLEKEDKSKLQDRLKELENRFDEINEAIKNSTDPEETKQLKVEYYDVLEEINNLDDQLKECSGTEVKECDSTETKENDGTESKEIKEEEEPKQEENSDEEVPAEPVEEPTEECPECSAIDEIDNLISKATEKDLPEFVESLNKVKETLMKEDPCTDETNEEPEADTVDEGAEAVQGEPSPDTEIYDSEELTECEVNSIRVLRVSPSTKAYMIETESKEGLKYLVGKNYDSEKKTLEEAEMFDDKASASNHFKSLLNRK